MIVIGVSWRWLHLFIEDDLVNGGQLATNVFSTDGLIEPEISVSRKKEALLPRTNRSDPAHINKTNAYNDYKPMSRYDVREFLYSQSIRLTNNEARAAIV